MKNVLAHFIFCIAALASVAGCGQEGLAITDPDLTWRPEKEIVLDCAWLSQEPSDTARTLNCGPTALVMAAGCIRGYAPEYNEVVDLITWMDEYIPSYNGVGVNDKGSYTNIHQLEEAAEGYYGLPSKSFFDPMIPGTAYSLQTISSLYANLKNGLPVIVGVGVQVGNGTDVLTNAQGVWHFMLLVGMTPTHVVLHDPEPWDASYGRYREYTIESFIKTWGKYGLQFLKEKNI